MIGNSRRRHNTYHKPAVKGFQTLKCCGFSLFLFTNAYFLWLISRQIGVNEQSPAIIPLHLKNNIDRNENGVIQTQVQTQTTEERRQNNNKYMIDPESDTIQGIPINMVAFTDIPINNSEVIRLQPLLSNNRKQQHHGRTKGLETIFISFPSLNDPDCNGTIISAFGNASNPDRLFIGIYEQNREDSNLDCLDISSVDCPWHPICTRMWQIRIVRVSLKFAHGPTWGRYNSDQLYSGQEFLFITDSHTIFRPFWDALLLELWYRTHNEFAIITHYPKPHSSMNADLQRWFFGGDGQKKSNHKYVPVSNRQWRKRMQTHPLSYHICGSIFEGRPNYMPRNANGCYSRIDGSRELHSALVPFWAAGFSFSRAHLREVVRFDPYTKYMFHGEEFHFGTRAFTHGYDFYTPSIDIAFHVYYDSNAGRLNINHIHDSNQRTLKDAAEKRANYIWGLLELRTPKTADMQKASMEDIEQYGLGQKRSLNSYWKFAGIDPIERTFTVFDAETYKSDQLIRVVWNEASLDPVLNPDQYLHQIQTNTAGAGREQHSVLD